MLTTLDKAKILGRAGFEVPACPEPEAPGSTALAAAADGGSDAAPESARQRWVRAVEILYATYAAARAAKSLRDAEEARQADMLRRLASPRAYA